MAVSISTSVCIGLHIACRGSDIHRSKTPLISERHTGAETCVVLRAKSVERKPSGFACVQPFPRYYQHPLRKLGFPICSNKQDNISVSAKPTNKMSTSATKRLRIAIINCPGSLAFDPMFVKWIEKMSTPLNCSVDWTVYQAEANDLPTAEERFDAYIITGSRNGVYEDFAWCADALVF